MSYEKLRKWKTHLVRQMIAGAEQELRTEFGWKLERGESPGLEEPGALVLVLSSGTGGDAWEDTLSIDLTYWAHQSGDRDFFERELHAEVDADGSYESRFSATMVDRLFWWSLDTENGVDWRQLKKDMRSGVAEEVAVWLKDQKMRSRVFNVLKNGMGPPILEHSELCWKVDRDPTNNNWGGWEVYTKDGTLRMWLSPWSEDAVRFEFRGNEKKWPTLDRGFVEGSSYPANKAVEMLLAWVCPLRLADELNALTC